MLINAILPKSFWVEDVNTASYLINRSPSSAIEFKVPEEVWTKAAVDYSNLQISGCPTYAHLSAGKLDPRSEKCLFLDCGDGIEGYRLWNMSSQKVIHSRDVVFNEEMLKTKLSGKLDGST